MTVAKETQVRMSQETRTDEYVVDDKLTVTRRWQGVSATVAKKLLSFEDKGKPLFETREVDASDNEAGEDGKAEAAAN